MTIGELSRRTGVPASAIRYYESQALMSTPPRTSGRRLYDPRAVTEVQVITAARELGFGIREIGTLVETRNPSTPVTARWRALARRKLPEMATLIERATKMKAMLESGLGCGCIKIEDCLLHGCVPSAPPLLQIRRSSPAR